ncbi:hypothetical protein L0Y34_02235 [Candidatus Parcubacteria bacterium]|nr:hypothetical protein [Candidatus Parcubacteria bacterium]
MDEYTRVLEAVAETADEKTAEAAVQKLIAHLKSSGRMKMLPHIARELRKIGARRRLHAPHVEVASEKEKARALAEARAAGIDAKDVHVNRALISGWRARSAGMLVDESGKRALIDIYRKIIA